LTGPRLRQLRLAKGLSLKELAERTGSSASAIHRYESGWGRFEIRTLRRLAAALDARLEIRLDPVERAGEGTPPTVETLHAAIAPLFWDLDLQPDHCTRHPQWVVRRVLHSGDRRQVTLVRRFYGDDAIRRAIDHRSVDPRVRRFWQVVLSREGAEG